MTDQVVTMSAAHRGRDTTLVEGRYRRMKSRFTVVRSARGTPQLRARATALRKTSRSTTAESAVQIDPVLEPRHVGDKVAKVTEAALADGGARSIWMHVDNVGAEGHVHGQRHIESGAGRSDAEAFVLRVAVVQVMRYRLAEAQAPRHAVVDGTIEQAAGFLRHAELSHRQLRLDVLGGRTGKRHFEIMNDARAVGGNRRDEPALHQVDNDRPEPGLDDVGAEAPHDAARCPRRQQRLDDGVEIGSGKDLRKPVQQAADARPFDLRAREGVNLALLCSRDFSG